MVLALIGSVNDDILQFEELAFSLISELNVKYPGIFKEKLDIDAADEIDILKEYSEKRNLLKAGGEIDVQRGAKMLIDDFRSNKLGYFTLDNIPENQ